MCDLHKKNKFLVCFQAIWKLSSPILFDITKLLAFPWRHDCVGPSQMRCQLSRYKATEETEYLIKQEFNLEECHSYPGNLGFLLFLQLSDFSFSWILFKKKIIITISGLDEVSDSFKKQTFVYNDRDNRFKEFPVSQAHPYWGFKKKR